MAKVIPRTPDNREVIKVRTQSKRNPRTNLQWWQIADENERCNAMLDAAAFLKEKQAYRFRQAGVYAGLYSNMPMNYYMGANISKMRPQALPYDRPTMNVIFSCIDTLVSRITQAKPRPVFLTDNANYKNRALAKQLNNFSQGELYQTKAYQKGAETLRKALVLGDGCLKVYETKDNKVGVDEVLATEILVDENDGLYGYPRTLYQFKLVDREVQLDLLPDQKKKIEAAEQAYPDQVADNSRTISDQIIIVEAWHLPSGPEQDDGMHMIGCTSGCILNEPYKKDKFPFVFLQASKRMLGFWGQGMAEQLMGTQYEINKLLITISRSINLVGVPRVFVEDGSKVVKAHLNNEIGSIITYRGTKPQYEVAPCVPAEVYQELQRLIQSAYQQSGVSSLSAASQKPQGLNSGVALREYDDLQSDRFAALVKSYDQMFIDLSDQILDKAIDIAERDGKYQTIYPGKDSVHEVDLPSIKILKENPFVIQAFDASSLPRDPAGRMERIVEMIQSGMISVQEGRRLLDYPDINQVNVLAIAKEERILKILDQIIEDGKYTPPDPFMDLDLALELVSQYYNLYIASNLEEKKAALLRSFSDQILDLKNAAMAAQAPMPQAGALPPQANPEPLPQSPMVPNGNPTAV